MKRIILIFTLLIFPVLLFAGEVKNVEASIEKNGMDFTFSIVNTSDSIVRINPPLFNDPVVLGHWLFLYDSNTKSLQTAWTTTFNKIDGNQGNLKFDELHPGGRIENKFTKKEVLGYFMIVPECFYMVYVVRLRQYNNVVISKPSNAIYMCK